MIETFCDALLFEEGLAATSVASYRNDLQLAARLLDKPVRSFDADDVQNVLARMMDLQRKPTSLAHMRTTLRRYFAWLAENGYRHDDPTARLEPARLQKPLPRSIGETDVEKLLAAPDPARQPAAATPPCSNCSTPAACALANSSACALATSTCKTASCVYAAKGKKSASSPSVKMPWLPSIATSIAPARNCSKTRWTTPFSSANAAKP